MHIHTYIRARTAPSTRVFSRLVSLGTAYCKAFCILLLRFFPVTIIEFVDSQLDQDQDLVTLEQSVFTHLLSVNAVMRMGVLHLQALLQEIDEEDVAGDEEDRGNEEVEGDILCNSVNGDEDEVEGGIFDYQSDSDRSGEDAAIETQAPPSTHDASTQAQDQAADGDGDGGEPAGQLQRNPPKSLSPSAGLVVIFNPARHAQCLQRF